MLADSTVDQLIDQFQSLKINTMAQQLQEILARLQALEEMNNPSTIDYSDPILIYENADPSAIEKLPDLVKEIPIFTGNSDELCGWIKDVDAIIKSYQPTTQSTVDQKNKFYAICVSVRRKIRGEANTALVNSNVNINWNLIKKTLQTYYGEKRDLTTLDYQLMNCTQKGRSLEIYFDEINKLLSLIASHIQSGDEFNHPEAARAMISIYNKKAIDAFIRGLDGDIGKFLKNHQPESLASAFSYCITYQNMEYRKFMTKPKLMESVSSSKNFILKPPPPFVPRIPSRPQPPLPRPAYNPIKMNYAPQSYNPNSVNPPRHNFNSTLSLIHI